MASSYGRHLKTDEKEWILNQILDKKQLLFGHHGDRCTTNSEDEEIEVTESTKKEAWQTIWKQCCEQNLPFCRASRDYTYLRKVVWGNMKDATTRKIDKRNQTGAAGGASCKWTDCDTLVQNILGRENPVWTGIGVPDSGERQSQAARQVEDDKLDSSADISTETLTTKQSSVTDDFIPVAAKKHSVLSKTAATSKATCISSNVAGSPSVANRRMSTKRTRLVDVTSEELLKKKTEQQILLLQNQNEESRLKQMKYRLEVFELIKKTPGFPVPPDLLEPLGVKIDMLHAVSPSEEKN